jgi:hypothetical protein
MGEAPEEIKRRHMELNEVRYGAGVAKALGISLNKVPK